MLGNFNPDLRRLKKTLAADGTAARQRDSGDPACASWRTYGVPTPFYRNGQKPYAEPDRPERLQVPGSFARGQPEWAEANRGKVSAAMTK